MNATRRVVAGMKATLVGRVVYLVANAALLVALTRYLLEPGEYGKLQFALSVLAVGRLASGFGIGKAGARYVTEYLETDSSQVPYLIRWAFGFAMATATLAAIAMALFHRELATLLNEPDAAPFLLVGAAYLFLAPFARFPRGMFQAFNRVDWSAVFRALEGVTRTAFAIGFVTLAGLGALGALAGYAVSFAVTGALGLAVLYVKFYAPLPVADSHEPGLARQLAEYAVPISVTQGADVLDSKVDTILVGSLLVGTAGVAFYSLARQIAVFAALPAQSLGYALSPALGEQKAGDDLEQAGTMYEQSIAYVLLLYVPGAVGLALVAEPLVRHGFNADYLGAVPVLQVLSAFVVLFTVNTNTSNALDYLGRASARAKARGVTAVCNFGLNVLLIPTIGVVGAAIATVITYSVYTLANLYVINQELPIRTSWLFGRLGRVSLIAAAVGAVVWVARPHIAGLPTLAGTILAGIAVWALLAVASGLLEPRKVAAHLA